MSGNARPCLFLTRSVYFHLPFHCHYFPYLVLVFVFKFNCSLGNHYFWRCLLQHTKRQLHKKKSFYNMLCLVMLITAVCLIFLLRLLLFSSGEEFSSTEKQPTEVFQEMQLSRRQNLSLRGQCEWAWPKREIWSLILWQKGIGITFLGFEYTFRFYRNAKITKALLAVWTL